MLDQLVCTGLNGENLEAFCALCLLEGVHWHCEDDHGHDSLENQEQPFNMKFKKLREENMHVSFPLSPLIQKKDNQPRNRSS